MKTSKISSHTNITVHTLEQEEGSWARGGVQGGNSPRPINNSQLETRSLKRKREGANLDSGEDELPLKRTDPKERNFRNRTLDYYDFSHCFLQHANFIGASLNHSTLRYSDLSFSDFQVKEAQSADFSGANFTQALLRGSNFSWSNFKNAALSGAILYLAECVGVSFENADMKKASFYKGNFEKSNFENANLENAYLKDANFKNTFLGKTNLENIYLSGCDFLNAIITDETKISFSRDELEQLLNNQMSRIDLNHHYHQDGSMLTTINSIGHSLKRITLMNSLCKGILEKHENTPGGILRELYYPLSRGGIFEYSDYIDKNGKDNESILELSKLVIEGMIKYESDLFTRGMSPGFSKFLVDYIEKKLPSLEGETWVPNYDRSLRIALRELQNSQDVEIKGRAAYIESNLFQIAVEEIVMPPRVYSF